MDRVIFVINEAMKIREYGGDRETIWEKVRPEHGTIAEVQAEALRSIEALADKAAGKNSVSALAKAAQEIESEVSVWLAVLARCFQLQNEYGEPAFRRVVTGTGPAVTLSGGIVTCGLHCLRP